MDWTEITVEVDSKEVETAEGIAQMTVPYGIYTEDYSSLEAEVMEIAHVDLIDEELLKKNRSIALIHVYISPEESPDEAVFFLSEHLSAAGILHKISKKACAAEDWRNIWKTFYKPIPVGEKLLVCPEWESGADAGERKVFLIDPGLAFGTGEHETTRLCLEAVEKIDLKGKDVLDVGCGSGVLSVCSLLLGARSAVGIDIDKTAVRTAGENAALNGFGEPEFRVFCGNLTEKLTGCFDVVFANIVADAVIALSAEIKSFMRPGAVFIASGIIEPRESDVLAAFSACGLKVISRKADGGWLCFECC